ncbi:hypothetical protein Ddye_023956 [Dipteronia dyeriana]|uniref:Protein IQ-DOMAIN 1 n=1 Tax=Dipteronia dyeriana TaxID=168575 RepID=A0AAD9TUI5_9ROSI|nr:hypothetical protein Ddye_023956 [Dipteronia dyeriana]
MGSGDWFKTIINSKKVKISSSKQVKGSSASAKSNGFKWKKRSGKESNSLAKSSTSGNNGALAIPVEDVAAIRIQTAIRAYMARKSLRLLKGTVRLQAVTQHPSVKMHATSALSYLHTWNYLHAEIRDRRLCMVKEGRLRQKKLENQQKLDAKLHDLEVEWHGGSAAMDVMLSRIHQREEAAVKRERAMAYAFSHQWRANSNPFGLSNYELRKADWGWSWKERWIAARPWESRVPPKFISPKKVQSKQASKVGKNIKSPKTPKSSTSAKASMSNGKGAMKPRRLSFPGAEKPTSRGVHSKDQLVS